MPQDVNATLNLPKTEFPMRAGLPKREPEILDAWNREDIYGLMMEKNEGKPLFILHDGPPFSNGDVHAGTALNKILKDFIIKHKNMSGFKAPYVPGWDNHGMPIESAIIKQQKIDRKKLSIPEFRSQCEAFARNFVGRHREQFIRLGVFGDWAHPYLTMDPDFEAREIKVFGQMAEKGYIYRGLKPVYWCPHDETALAEAEIEYEDEKNRSIYVKFRVSDDKGKLAGLCDPDNTYFVIWTTTTWTLPGNVAISVHPRLNYVLVRAGQECFIVAETLLEAVARVAGWDNPETVACFAGSELEYMVARHPFLDRDSLIITGEHVTADSGTGCVHTAPGHGTDDYFACKPYNLPIVVPVDDRGFMTEEAGVFAGLYYQKANDAIFEELKSSGALLAFQMIDHTYPHCWRCHNPVVYRATEQWFASVDAIKDAAVEAVDSVTWTPSWGHDRMVSMVRERAEWCISRQRHWGLPIPVFYCDSCGGELITPQTIDAVSDLFAREGSNAWYLRPAEEILPEGTTCPHCGHTVFTKETDTLDGWFDSGSSHATVTRINPALRWPADLYLEGGDQYRGWFQSSLLTAIATVGRAPYKAVLTHGWIVDGEGKKMSKSIGNVVSPIDVVDQRGADIFRLWASSVDYRVDVRISNDLFKQLSDIYLKIRNTARYILGNLSGFDPESLVAYKDLPELDRWALMRLNGLCGKVQKAYNDYEFHIIYHAVHNFCAVDMSSFYLDIIKDRLYCEAPDGLLRRSAQTVIFAVLDSLVRMIAPILSFTAEEIWGFMPHQSDVDFRSVFLNDMPGENTDWTLDQATTQKWDRLIALREKVNMALEQARSDKLIGKPLEAAVTLTCDEKNLTFLSPLQGELASLFIVSGVILKPGSSDGCGVSVARSPGVKCPRCWMYFSGEEGQLCPRCSEIVSQL